MPHITAPSRPETEVGEAVEVVEDVKVDTGRRRRNVRRARGAGAPPRARAARARAGAERSSPTAASRRPLTSGIAITTMAYPAITARGRRIRAPAATHAAETNSTTPSASAVGGIAAFSAGVRSIGAGSQWVRATSAAPANTATTG